MNEILEGITGITDYITKAPATILIILGCNAIGFGLKHTPLPNRSIPLAVMLCGVLLTMFLCPLPEGRNPMLRLGVMGLLFGVVAWLAHAVILKRLEKFLPDAIRPETEPTTKPPTETKP